MPVSTIGYIKRVSDNSKAVAPESCTAELFITAIFHKNKKHTEDARFFVWIITIFGQ